MFTGLITSIGSIERALSQGAGLRLRVRHGLPGEPLTRGESIAVDGCCLTVVAFDDRAFEADLSPETLTRSGGRARWRVAREVNLERALAVGERLGGHHVQGHVDGLGRIVSIRREAGGTFRLRVALDAASRTLVVEKGSIALDGVSLTIAARRGLEVDVAVIPETWNRTTLSRRRPGDTVTVEYDVLARYAQASARGGENHGAR